MSSLSIENFVRRQMLSVPVLVLTIPFFSLLYWSSDALFVDLETNFVWLWPINAGIAFLIALCDRLFANRSVFGLYLLALFFAYELGAFMDEFIFEPVWSVTNLIEVIQVGLIAILAREVLSAEDNQRFQTFSSALWRAALVLIVTTSAQSYIVWLIEGGDLIDLVVSWMMGVVLPTVFALVAAYALTEECDALNKRHLLISLVVITLYSLSDFINLSFYAKQMFALLCFGVLLILPLRIMLIPFLVIALIAFTHMGSELIEYDALSLGATISAVNVSILNTILLSGVLLFAAVQERSRRAVKLSRRLSNQVQEGMALGGNHLLELEVETGYARVVGGDSILTPKGDFVLNEQMKEILTAEDFERFKVLITIPGASDVFRFVQRGTSDTAYWGRVTVGQPYRYGGVSRVLVLRQIVTEQMLAQINLELTLEELNELAEKQKRMFAVIGHELRTPAASLAMMLDPVNEPELKTYLEPMRSASQQLLSTLDELRMVALPEKAAVDRLEIASVSKVVSNTVKSLDPQTKAWGFNVYLDIEPGSDRELVFNVQALRQVTTNLIKNSCVHSGGDSVWVGLSNIGRDAEYAQLLLTVEDNGSGIPAEHRQKLFESFFRGDKRREGTGLGLSIVQNLARVMGGDIEYFESDRGGAGFRVVLVFGVPSESPKTAANKVTLSGLRVLFVEDNATIQLLSKTILEKVGADIVVASNGVDALQAYDSGKEFDLVLTDIQMPEMDGIELAQQLRTRGYVKPIICISAAAPGSETESILVAGANAVISKPISVDSLEQTLAQIVVH